MAIKQISVFVENKPGRLADITELLAKNNIDIRAISIADTTDFGILRLIVKDPDAVVNILKEDGMTVSATEVLGVAIPDVPGGFAKAIRIITDKGISLEYAYAFITPKSGSAYVIIRVSDIALATEALNDAGIKIIEQNEIF
ncbi:MAG: ACT domain-containing protein [Clostridiales bacterium]|nr:ACT domain-containing protein [Clostridiales bacterium]